MEGCILYMQNINKCIKIYHVQKWAFYMESFTVEQIKKKKKESFKKSMSVAGIFLISLCCCWVLINIFLCFASPSAWSFSEITDLFLCPPPPPHPPMEIAVTNSVLWFHSRNYRSKVARACVCGGVWVGEKPFFKHIVRVSSRDGKRLKWNGFSFRWLVIMAFLKIGFESKSYFKNMHKPKYLFK